MRYQFQPKDRLKGGKTTVKKYGREHMKRIGKKGRKKQLKQHANK